MLVALPVFSMYAPVVLFVYHRPWHTRRTVEALLANAEAAKTPLYIFSDAPKNAAVGQAVAEVRSYIHKINGFESISIIERERNWGLARSIIDGVSLVCQQYGRVIVLEDDIVVSPFFLKFMNDGLQLYEHDKRVISIHGYVFPVKATLPETFFLKEADCWGWATWKRGWDLFEPDGQLLLRELKKRKLTHRFDLDGAYPHTKMLKAQIKGKNDSWAIRWHASAFIKGLLTLYPRSSLVQNIGFDDSGTHCSINSVFSGELAHSQINVEQIPVEENVLARQQVVRFLKRIRPIMLKNRLRKLPSISRRWLRTLRKTRD